MSLYNYLNLTPNSRNSSKQYLFCVKIQWVLDIGSSLDHTQSRAVARSENPGGHVVLGGDNVPPLVEIGLDDLPKSGGARAPHLRRAC